MQIHTGRGFEAETFFGTYTFKYKQSSEAFTPNVKALCCGQAFPKSAAERTPCQAGAAAGGCHRRSPTGGAAKGIPRYDSVLLSYFPCTKPLVVLRIGPDAEAAATAAANKIPVDRRMLLQFYNCRQEKQFRVQRDTMRFDYRLQNPVRQKFWGGCCEAQNWGGAPSHGQKGTDSR